MKLDVKALAATVALVWGIGLFIMTWWIITIDGSSADPTFLGQIYRGYSITPVGSFVGLAWGVVDGAIGGAIFAWGYNFLVTRRMTTD